MQPDIHLNWPAILVSVVAAFAIGALWYGPLFGKTWARAMGLGDARPATAEIVRGSVLNVIGTFFMAFVLAHEVEVWRPSVWGVGTDAAPQVYGFYAAFFPWLGFVVPMLLNGVAYERKSWKVFGINAGNAILGMIAITMILSHWR